MACHGWMRARRFSKAPWDPNLAVSHGGGGEEGWCYLPSFMDRKKRNHLIWAGGRGLWRILTGLRYMPPLRPGVTGTMTVAPCRTPRLGGCSGRGTVLQMGIVFPLDRGGSRQSQRTDIYGRQGLRE